LNLIAHGCSVRSDFSTHNYRNISAEIDIHHPTRSHQFIMQVSEFKGDEVVILRIGVFTGWERREEPAAAG